MYITLYVKEDRKHKDNYIKKEKKHMKNIFSSDQVGDFSTEIEC